jgi:two-component system, OmpR family, phosphate regulon sensor histidine kinase PhoR
MEHRSALGDESLERLLDAAPDPVLVVDAAGVVRFASGPATFLLGHATEELLERPLDRFVPGWRQARRTAGTEDWGAVALHRDGRSVPVELSLVPVGRDAAEELTGVFLRDISDRLHLESENERLREELIANISHELQTPLTSIIGYAELLRDLGDDELGPQARRLVEIVHRNAHRELRLVEDLLAVSFQGDHLGRMASDAVDLVAVASRIVAERQPFADGAGLALTAEATGPAYVRGDQHHHGRLVEHLVVNACKFSPPGAAVRVQVATDDSSVTLAVVDTGIGVSEAEAARLFERLYRAPGAIDRQVEGAGLGLAIAKAITEAHAGTIDLDSTIGVGTTVTVRLPRVR